MADIKYNSYYIAGVSTGHIYLGNPTAPLHLLITSTTLLDTQHVKLNIENFKKLNLRSLFTKVDSPYFYLMDGIKPALFKGKTSSWTADRFMYDSAYFTDAVPISPASFIIRSLNGHNEYMLGKEIANDTPHVKFTAGLLEKQIDGMFCVEGMMHYSKRLNKLVYIYYYRNQYSLIDTSLNLVSRGNTIDTISRAQIKVGSIHSENSFTMAAPPLFVNKHSCVSGNFLLIHSNLMAKNENQEDFDQASVIDVYDLRDHTYQFSFYLHDREEKKMRAFCVVNNKLFALYDHYIISYDLNSKYFRELNM